MEEELRPRDKSLGDRIDELKEILEESKEKKKLKLFKTPRQLKLRKGQLKNNYVGIAFIQDNGDVKFLREQIVEGTVMINKTPYIATPEHIMSHKGKPFMIIPSWNNVPFSPENNIREANENKTNSIGSRLLLNRMKSEVIAAKKKFGAGIIIFGVLVLLGIGYYIFKHGI